MRGTAAVLLGCCLLASNMTLSRSGLLKELQGLAKLHSVGELTDSEYHAAKQRVIYEAPKTPPPSEAEDATQPKPKRRAEPLGRNVTTSTKSNQGHRVLQHSSAPAPVCLDVRADVGPNSYAELAKNAGAFPPLDPPDAGKVHVYIHWPIHTMVINTISPANSEFDIRFQTDWYWSADECAYGEATESACASEVYQYHFAVLENAVPDPETTASRELSGLWRRQRGADCVQADYVDVKAVVKNHFEMAYYPFEAHRLRLAFKSWSSIDIVELHIVEKINETLAGGKLGNLAPPGWDADSLLCDYTKVQSEEDVGRGNKKLEYSVVYCDIIVSKVATGYMFRDLIFFMSTIVVNCLLGLRTIQTWDIEDKDAEMLTEEVEQVTNNLFERCLTSLGFMISYALIMQPSPYDAEIDYWPTMPTSSWIYCTGLFCLLISGAESLVVGLIAQAYLRNRQKAPKWWQACSRGADGVGVRSSDKGIKVKDTLQPSAHSDDAAGSDKDELRFPRLAPIERAPDSQNGAGGANAVPRDLEAEQNKQQDGHDQESGEIRIGEDRKRSSKTDLLGALGGDITDSTNPRIAVHREHGRNAKQTGAPAGAHVITLANVDAVIWVCLHMLAITLVLVLIFKARSYYEGREFMDTFSDGLRPQMPRMDRAAAGER